MPRLTLSTILLAIFLLPTLALAGGLSKKGAKKLDDFDEMKQKLKDKMSPPYDPDKDQTSTARFKIERAEMFADTAEDYLEDVPESDRGAARYTSAEKWLEGYRERLETWADQAENLDEQRKKKSDLKYDYIDALPEALTVARQIEQGKRTPPDMRHKLRNEISSLEELWPTVEQLPAFAEKCRGKYKDVDPENPRHPKPARAADMADRAPRILKSYAESVVEKYLELRVDALVEQMETIREVRKVETESWEAVQKGFDELLAEDRKVVEDLLEVAGLDVPDNIPGKYKKVAKSFKEAVYNAASEGREDAAGHGGSSVKKALRKAASEQRTGKVVRTVVTDAEWNVERNADDDPVRRSKGGLVLVRDDSGEFCRAYSAAASQEALRDGGFSSRTTASIDEDSFYAVSCR